MRRDTVLPRVRRVLDERVLLGLFLVVALGSWPDAASPHRTWTGMAVPAYAVALVVALVRPRRGWGALVALVGALVVPTVLLVAQGAAQPEVGVVLQGAHDLLHRGSPYLASPQALYDWRPYLPALFLFGVPAQVLGTHLGDPRLLAAVLLAACLVGGARLLGVRRRDVVPGGASGVVGVTALTLASPWVAQTVATSFVDVPQAALTLLAVALVHRDRPGRAGVAAGICLALKPTAVIGLFVLWLFARARPTRSPGHRDARRLAASAIGTAVVLVLPVALRDPAGLWRNAVLFPLGRSGPESPARTPFPGVLIHQALPHSVLLTALTAACGLAYAAWCWRRVDASPVTTAALLAGGLALSFLLAPYSRAGYFAVPLVVFFPVLAMARAGARRPRPPTPDPAPVRPRARAEGRSSPR